MRRVVEFLEGMIFVCCLPFLMPLLIFVVIRSRCHNMPVKQDIRLLFRHWGVFVFRGWAWVRKHDWPLFSLENYWSLWRYGLLLEVFCILNVGRSNIRSQNQESPVLFVLLRHIGDTLLAEPAYRLLSRTNGDKSIDVLVSPGCSWMVRRWHRIGRVMEYAPALSVYTRSGQKTGIIHELKILFMIRNRRYGLVVMPENFSLFGCVLREAIFPGTWLGSGQHFSILPERRMNTRLNSYRTDLYEVLRVLSIVLQGTDKNLDDLDKEFHHPSYAVTEQENAALKMLNDHGVSNDQKLVAMVPGAGWPGKVWSADRFGHVCSKLNEWGYKIVLFGDSGDRDIGRIIESTAGVALINLIGMTSVAACAVIMKQCVCYVGNDNGLMHIADALGIPVLAIFGPTQAIQWGPRNKHVTVIQNKRCGKTCYPWHPLAKCGHLNRCVDNTGVDEVIAKLRDILSIKESESE